MIVAAVTVLLLVLLAAGLPVAFALAIAGSVGLYILGGFTFLVGFLETTPLSTVASYELVSVPMFLLMAELLVVSGIADDLFRAMAVWVGRVRGGLAVATALTGACFGAITGSSTASAATLASTTIPAMIKQGYEPKLTYGVVSISGTLAMLIPPSIAIIIYGLLTELSIAKLLIAGVIPGLLVTLTIVLTIYVLIWKDPSRAPVARPYSVREKLAQVYVAGPFVGLFFLVTGLMYLGICTPTEASGLGAFGAFTLAAIRRRLSIANLSRAVARAARTTSMICLIIIATQIFAYFLTLTQTTQNFVAFMAGVDAPRWVILLGTICLYIVLGCLMDQVAILILTVPLLVPLMVQLGYDPIWFGIMIIVLAEIGMVSPPVGLNVFVVAQYARAPVEQAFSGVFPHVIAHLFLVALLACFPEIVLWLPSTM